MTTITVDSDNSTPIELYYEDHGTGDPVVLIHGWPLSGRSWEKQVPALIGAGYRVITYDRRGFGVLRLSWTIAAGASPKGTHDLVAAWGTDFRADLGRFAVPTLIVHGDADRIVPLEVSGQRMPALVKGSRLVVIKGGPHGLNWTHAEELNQALLEFLRTR